MLQLLYTGARSYLGQQNKAQFSLGGYPSSNVIHNSEQGALFSNVSPYGIQNEIRNVIAVILKNNGDTQLSNVEFYFNIPETAICKYEIAAVALTLNSKGEYIMEEIGNNQSLPYNATFYEANGQEGAVDLGPLASGAMLGLWIKRTIDFTSKTDDELFEDFKNGVEQVNKEIIELVFNETVVEESSSSSSI